jgi:hypothetical protein
MAGHPTSAFPGTSAKAETPSRQVAKLLAIDTPLDAILDQGNIKIDQQPQLVTREPQVGDKLGFVDRQNLFDRLDLHDEQPSDNQIHPEPRVDLDVAVSDRQRHLPLKGDFTHLQLTDKALLVHRLQQSRTQRAMHSERGINDLSGNKIVLRRGFNHLGALALNWNRSSAQTNTQ